MNPKPSQLAVHKSFTPGERGEEGVQAMPYVMLCGPRASAGKMAMIRKDSPRAFQNIK